MTITGAVAVLAIIVAAVAYYSLRSPYAAPGSQQPTRAAATGADSARGARTPGGQRMMDMRQEFMARQQRLQQSRAGAPAGTFGK